MIAVCIKWLSVNSAVEQHDGSPGSVVDQRFGGISAADQAAVEWALRLGALRREEVTALTLGRSEADSALRQAAAAGVDRCVRIDSPPTMDSVEAAAAIAARCSEMSFVWCGDYSLDRGTGSVPAFVAAMLGRPMGLGAVGVDLGNGTTIELLRRLDGGRRERLRLSATGVISVEGSTAKLRRAPLSRTLAAASTVIEVITPVAQSAHGHTSNISTTTSPYRPRARQLPPPTGDDPLTRLRELTSTGAPSTRGETVVLEPRAAAERIVAALTSWGYLHDSTTTATH
jgi:electron transfer flavoprotein beta subunit